MVGEREGAIVCGCDSEQSQWNVFCSARTCQAVWIETPVVTPGVRLRKGPHSFTAHFASGVIFSAILIARSASVLETPSSRAA